MLNNLKFLIQDNKHPYFIADFKTLDVLYCNHEMKKILFGNPDVIGKPFYQVISDDNANTPPDLSFDNDISPSQKISDPTLQRNFNVTYIKVEDTQEKYLLIQYEVLRGREEKQKYHNLAKDICWLDMEPDEKIHALLHLLAKAYRGDCSYVHFLDHTNKTIKLEHSWVNHTITDTTHFLVQDIKDIAGFDGIVSWTNGRNEEGFLECDVARTGTHQQVLDKMALSILGRKNLLLWGIDNSEGELVAVVSVGDCESLDVNHDLLKYVKGLIESLIK